MTPRDHKDEHLFTFDGQRGLHRNQDNPLTPRLTSPFFSRSMSTVLIPSAMLKDLTVSIYSYVARPYCLAMEVVKRYTDTFCLMEGDDPKS